MRLLRCIGQTAVLLVGLCQLSAGYPRLGAPGSAGLGHVVDQQPLRQQYDTSGRKLKGRFLHITDIHPDPYYRVYSSTKGDSACHRGSGPAGFYGAETSGCDSPLSLLNETFKWIRTHLRDEIDFVVWTGDSARHDNDEEIPRSEHQIVSQNELVVERFLDAFGKPENYDDEDPTNDFVIPIIPTLGNNDILPHNIFMDGPNAWTRKYQQIWRQFIPEAQRHQFQRGGWFYVEVIPSRLAVISLNTLYFFASNSAVDGCAIKSEPGYEQFEWLRIQLQLFRQRGIKAILTGHVPPARVDSKTSWDETCWQKYALWLRQYRDVILASLFGHMNIDHFMLEDFNEIKKHIKKGTAFVNGKTTGDSGELAVQASADYLLDLRSSFGRIPDVVRLISESDAQSTGSWQRVPSNLRFGKRKPPFSAIGGPYGERYSLSLVQSSIVPNYFPTLRIYEYNISGLELISLPDHRLPRNGNYINEGVSAERALYDRPNQQLHDRNHCEAKPAKREKSASRKKRKHKFKVPRPPSKSSPPGPAYSPQVLTLLGYKQYYANLTLLNHDFHRDDEKASDDGSLNTSRWKEGKHRDASPPRKSPKPKPFKFEVEYSTFDDPVYALEDLTVRNYLKLASRMATNDPEGKFGPEQQRQNDLTNADERSTKEEAYKRNCTPKHRRPRPSKDSEETNDGTKPEKKKKMNQVWLTFVRRAFVGTLDDGEIEDRFGP